MHRLTVPTRQREEFVEITDDLRRVVAMRGWRDGILTVFVPHTTAGVTINENADPDVVHDMLLALRNLVPREQSGFRHAEGNSDSHVKASWMGSSCQVLVERGELVLGTWQGVQFCEFDGPRTRSVWVSWIGGGGAA
ncbi:MAG: secondary thiamine-phosphate synthase enzyme YjbQ [Planctomycetaceae bacterium]|jgi:secondary thiamine-phosphate synthase enzyme